MNYNERIFIYTKEGEIQAVGGCEVLEKIWEDFQEDNDAYNSWLADNYYLDEDYIEDEELFDDFINSGGDGYTYVLEIGGRPKKDTDKLFQRIS